MRSFNSLERDRMQNRTPLLLIALQVQLAQPLSMAGAGFRPGSAKWLNDRPRPQPFRAGRVRSSRRAPPVPAPAPLLPRCRRAAPSAPVKALRFAAVAAE